MFASPPYKAEKEYVIHSFTPLDHKQEFRCIQESINKAKIEITVNKIHGTRANITNMLTQNRPGALHFSGHVLSKDEIKKRNVESEAFTNEEIAEIYKRGHALVLEDDSYLGEYFHADELERIVEKNQIRLDFVFMESHYSECSAEIFINAGALNVICIDKSTKIDEHIILQFASNFYSSVWKQGS